MRIGRSALDEEAIRLIEEHNPDVEFDWTRILKGQDAPVESRAPAPQDRHGRQRRDFAPRPPAARAPSAARAVEAPTSSVPMPPPESKVAPADAQPIADAPAVGDALPVADAPPVADALALVNAPPAGDAPPDEGLSQMAEMPEIALLEELLADPAAEGPADRIVPEAAVSAVQARLGSEGLSRLRARHSEVLARISETVADPVRRDELKSQADRLNPDTWVTEAEVTAGLEAYESVFESLRTVVGRRRKRRRRSGRRPGDASSSGGREVSQEQAADGDEADIQETDKEP